MTPYDLYTVDDFVADTDFQGWVQGNSEQESFWLSFLQRYPHQAIPFRQAEQFIRAVSTERNEAASDAIGEPAVRREVERFLDRIASYSPPHPAPGRTIRPRDRTDRPVLPGRRLLWAALILVALVAGWFRITHLPAPAEAPLQANRPTASEALVETTNNTPNLLRLVLTDGSEVMLRPKSQLRYPARFTASPRIVHLKGEALFAVRRQTNPFFVYTGDMVTKVLGTRFVVRAFEADGRFTVQVLSGKVSVHRQKSPPTVSPTKETNGLILSVNQAAVFDRNDGNLIKTLIANPGPVVPATRPGSLVYDYDEVLLPVILRELEMAYGIPIQVDAQSFATTRITAKLSEESLYEKLDLLCKAAQATYEITDGQIIISRK